MKQTTATYSHSLSQDGRVKFKCRNQKEKTVIIDWYNFVVALKEMEGNQQTVK